MKIAVYCGSSRGINPNFMRDAKILGKWIGENGHTLVYGGSDTGLMGRVADATLENGGQVIGVIPDIDFIKARSHKGLTQYIYSKDLSERKLEMIKLSDAFVALPGGPGTLDEISDIFSLTRVGKLDCPTILYNTDGYYEMLWKFLLSMDERKFSNEGDFRNILLSENIDEIGKFIEKSMGE